MSRTRVILRPPHCTLAVTEALALTLNVQDLVLLPPLEHAPDQIASRPFDTLNVIEVPVANDAEPVLPTATLMPVGVDTTRSPLRPVAVRVNDADCEGGVPVGGIVNRRTDENGPAVPAELIACARHQY